MKKMINQLLDKERSFDWIQKAINNPKSKATAIAAKCWDCNGRGCDGVNTCIEGIRECSGYDCPLWIHRPYQKKRNKDIKKNTPSVTVTVPQETTICV